MPAMTIAQISAGLDEGTFSSAEITQTFLDAIKADASGAYISINEEKALEAARRQDELRAPEGGTSPLAGVPMAHKDIFCTKGMTTTAGSHMLENFVAPYDATVVERIDELGQ